MLFRIWKTTEQGGDLMADFQNTGKFLHHAQYVYTPLFIFIIENEINPQIYQLQHRQGQVCVDRPSGKGPCDVDQSLGFESCLVAWGH